VQEKRSQKNENQVDSQDTINFGFWILDFGLGMN
jgi:hypothetical protein